MEIKQLSSQIPQSSWNGNAGPRDEKAGLQTMSIIVSRKDCFSTDYSLSLGSKFICSSESIA